MLIDWLIDWLIGTGTDWFRLRQRAETAERLLDDERDIRIDSELRMKSQFEKQLKDKEDYILSQEERLLRLSTATETPLSTDSNLSTTTTTTASTTATASFPPQY